jgi:hypothetical protein
MNTLKLVGKILIGILLLALIAGSIFYFSQQETVKTRIIFGDEEKIVTLHSSDRYIYPAKSEGMLTTKPPRIKILGGFVVKHLEPIA